MSVTVTPNYLVPTGNGGYTLDPAMFSVGGWDLVAHGPLQIYKDPFGHVFMRGSLSNISPSIVAIIDSEYRPSQTHAFVVETNRQTYASFYVDASGRLVYSSGPALGQFDEVSLDVLHWRAAG